MERIYFVQHRIVLLLLLAFLPATAQAQSGAEYEAWLEWCISIGGTPNYDPNYPVCTPGAVAPVYQMPPDEAPTTPEEEFRAYIDSARRLIKQGKLDRARRELEEALVLFPDDAEALALKQELDTKGAPLPSEPSLDAGQYPSTWVYGAPHPDQQHVFWDGSGWVPAEGWAWASEDPTDLRVVPAAPPPPEPSLDTSNLVPNADGTYSPALGYTWASEDPTDLRVVPVAVAPAVTTPPEPSNASTVDLRDLDPTSLVLDPARIQAGSYGPAVASGVLVDVPSPTGYRSESERREQVARLSDERIEAEIARVEALLWRMQQDFENDSASMDEWLEVAEDAEREALKASFDLLLNGTMSALLENQEQMKSLFEMAKTGKLFLGASAAADAAESEVQLRLARDAMIQLYENVRILDKELVSKLGANGAELAKFTVSYSYEVARWALAYESIRSISDNLDAPNGKLKAQAAVSRLYEDLIQERNRRLAAVPGQ